VVGVADASKLLEILPNKIRDVLGIVPRIDLLTDDEKGFIRITVEPYHLPGQLQGPLPPSQRRHQSGTDRPRAQPLSTAQDWEALGRDTGAGVFAR